MAKGGGPIIQALARSGHGTKLRLALRLLFELRASLPLGDPPPTPWVTNGQQ